MRWRKWIPIFPRVVRAGAGSHDLGSGDNGGDALPELAVRCDVENTESGDQDPGRRSVPSTDEAGSEEYDSWDAIAGYVFQVSNPLLRVAIKLLSHFNGRTPMLRLY